MLLAISVVLSSYERRVMSLLHNRDAPVVYLVSGLAQPVADGGKLVMKSTVVTLLLVDEVTTEHSLVTSTY